MDGKPTPPQTPKVFEFIAVPRDDATIGRAASAAYANMQWLSPDRDRMAQGDWQAYQNLMQLAGIMQTAKLSNASQVWNEIVEYVETIDMAVALQPEIPRGQKRSEPSNSFALVITAPPDAPGAGNTATTAQSSATLTSQQHQQIAEKRRAAEAIKAAKQAEQRARAASGAVGSTATVMQKG